MSVCLSTYQFAFGLVRQNFSHSPSRLQTHYVAEVGFEFLVLLTLFTSQVLRLYPWDMTMPSDFNFTWLIFKFYLFIYFLCACVCVSECGCTRASGYMRTTWGSQFFPSTLCTLGIWTQVFRKHFQPLSHLTSPISSVLKAPRGDFKGQWTRLDFWLP